MKNRFLGVFVIAIITWVGLAACQLEGSVNTEPKTLVITGIPSAIVNSTDISVEVYFPANPVAPVAWGDGQTVFTAATSTKPATNIATIQLNEGSSLWTGGNGAFNITLVVDGSAVYKKENVAIYAGTVQIAF
jgi:hypothetical protein